MLSAVRSKFTADACHQVFITQSAAVLLSGVSAKVGIQRTDSSVFRIKYGAAAFTGFIRRKRYFADLFNCAGVINTAAFTDISFQNIGDSTGCLIVANHKFVVVIAGHIRNNAVIINSAALCDCTFGNV